MGRGEYLGEFEQIVLLAVARLGADGYGMQIRREIEARTDRAVTIGAVYATLDRLEAKKLVDSKRSNVDGVSRRLFSVTANGARALADSRAMRERLWKGVDLRLLLD